MQDKASKAPAVEVLRSLIDRVTLVPEDGQLAIVLRGELAAMWHSATNKKRTATNGSTWKCNYRWLRGEDLNLRPSGYEFEGQFHLVVRRNALNFDEFSVLHSFGFLHCSHAHDLLCCLLLPICYRRMDDGAAQAHQEGSSRPVLPPTRT